MMKKASRVFGCLVAVVLMVTLTMYASLVQDKKALSLLDSAEGRQWVEVASALKRFPLRTVSFGPSCGTISKFGRITIQADERWPKAFIHEALRMEVISLNGGEVAAILRSCPQLEINFPSTYELGTRYTFEVRLDKNLRVVSSRLRGLDL